MRVSLILACALAGAVLSGCATLKKPFFYEIERDHQVSYVLGTVHVGVEASELPGFIRDDLSKSRVYLSEMSQEILDRRDERTLQRYLIADFNENVRTGNRLSSHLKPETFKQLRACLLTAVPPELKEKVDFLPPSLAYSLAFKAQGPEEVEMSRADAFRIRYSRMDDELYRSAKEQNKTLLPIDRSKQIWSCADKQFFDDIEALFAARLNGAKARPSGTRIIDVYREGDEDALLAETQRTDGGRLDECILGERNEAWADLIDRLDLAQGPYFVAVGAAHLVGPEGLISRLKAKGFTARRVTSAP
jgi:uncharacterized protein YbaP (TraB family)